jgi:hypothetical protein
VKNKFIVNRQRSPRDLPWAGPKLLFGVVIGLALAWGLYPGFGRAETMDNSNNPIGYEDESQENYENMNREGYQDLDDEKSVDDNQLNYEDEDEEKSRNDDSYDYQNQSEFDYQNIN